MYNKDLTFILEHAKEEMNATRPEENYLYRIYYKFDDIEPYLVTSYLDFMDLQQRTVHKEPVTLKTEEDFNKDKENGIDYSNAILIDEREPLKETSELLDIFYKKENRDKLENIERLRYEPEVLKYNSLIVFTFKDNKTDFKILEDNIAARLYFCAKEFNIPFDGIDDHFMHDIVDLNYEAEREVRMEIFSESINDSIKSNDFSEIEDQIAKTKQYISDVLKEKDPITAITEVAEKYKEAYERFQEKLKKEGLVLPEGVKNYIELEKTNPELFKKFQDFYENHVDEEYNIGILEIQYKALDTINKQMMAEVSYQYEFDVIYDKLCHYIELAEKNGNNDIVKFYQVMKKCYEESYELTPMLEYLESYLQKRPGKMVNTVTNGPKIIKKVRQRMSATPNISFLDPVIIPFRIDQLFNDERYVDKFSFLTEEDKLNLPYVVYYSFAKFIDESKNNYLRQKGLFIMKFLHHLYYFYSEKLFSKRDIFVDKISQWVKYLKDDIECEASKKKYKDWFKINGTKYIESEMKKLKDFLDMKKAEYQKKQALQNMVTQSLIEDEESPFNKVKEEEAE